jgi:hypothetical protein
VSFRAADAAIGRGSLAVREKASAPAEAAIAARGWVVRPAVGRSPRWLYSFIVFEYFCQLILLSEASAGYRVFIRSTAFSASLAALVLVRDDSPNNELRRAPAFGLGIAVVGLNVLEFFHPTTASWLAAFATAGLALAVLAPVFWVPKLRIDEPTLRRVFLLYWVFNTVSALVGALQVAFPGRFQPAISSGSFASLTMTLANGETMMRPMGLTDMPGGAGVGGLYASLLGIGFILHNPPRAFRMALIASTALGVYMLYLSQVRILLVMFVVAFIGVLSVLIVQQRFARMTVQWGAVAVLGVAALSAAKYIGGQEANERFSSLTEQSVGNVYYSNRGHFLEETVTWLVPEFPLGAGLGRHGIVSAYFGAESHYESNAAATPIYSELNWTSWILDGGVPLALLYGAALFVTVRFVFRAATRRINGALGPLAGWAAILFGYDLSVLLLTLDAKPFETSFGCDFWLLNGAFFCASLFAGERSLLNGGISVRAPGWRRRGPRSTAA